MGFDMPFLLDLCSLRYLTVGFAQWRPLGYAGVCAGRQVAPSGGTESRCQVTLRWTEMKGEKINGKQKLPELE